MGGSSWRAEPNRRTHDPHTSRTDGLHPDRLALEHRPRALLPLDVVAKHQLLGVGLQKRLPVQVGDVEAPGMVAQKRLPPPDYPLGPNLPLWDDDKLDAHDAAAAAQA